MEDIAKRIKYLRGSRTQRDFARTVSCNEATLRSYERGLSNPNFEFIHALCMTHHVSPDWLMFGRGSVYDAARAAVYPQAEGIQSGNLHEEAGVYTPASSSSSSSACARCVLYEEEVVREQDESHKAMITAQFLLAENVRLTAENGKLRMEKLHLQHALNMLP